MLGVENDREPLRERYGLVHGHFEAGLSDAGGDHLGALSLLLPQPGLLVVEPHGGLANPDALRVVDDRAQSETVGEGNRSEQGGTDLGGIGTRDQRNSSGTRGTIDPEELDQFSGPPGRR